MFQKKMTSLVFSIFLILNFKASLSYADPTRNQGDDHSSETAPSELEDDPYKQILIKGLERFLDQEEIDIESGTYKLPFLLKIFKSHFKLNTLYDNELESFEIQ